MKADRQTVQDCFIRVCRDSNFTIDAYRAAQLTGRMCQIHPLLVWAKFPDVQVMEAIAAGTHPAVSRHQHSGDEA